MTAPDRIWIDAWGGNWSPRAGGTQEIEYTRADLIPAALAVPEVAALVEKADRIANWTIGNHIADHPENREKYPLLSQAIIELREALAALRGEGGNG